MRHIEELSFVLAVSTILATTATVTLAQNALSIETVEGLDADTPSVSLALTMDSPDLERHAVSLAISYDESMATLLDVDVTGTEADGADWSAGTICNGLDASCLASGGVLWSIIMEIESPDGMTLRAIGPGTGLHIASLHFDTSGMDTGDTMPVTFQDGLDIFGVPGRNEIVNEVTSVKTPELALTDGAISFDAGIVFRRGDHDGSGVLDITDAINLLGFIFLGTTPPICGDASDADNRGVLDITHALDALGFIFLGSFPMEETLPGPINCGPDPTVILDPDGPGGFPEQPVVTLGCDMYPAETGLACE